MNTYILEHWLTPQIPVLVEIEYHVNEGKVFDPQVKRMTHNSYELDLRPYKEFWLFDLARHALPDIQAHHDQDITQPEFEL